MTLIHRTTALPRCVRRSPSNATSARAMIIKPASRPVPWEQLCASNPPPSSAQPRKYCNAELCRELQCLSQQNRLNLAYRPGNNPPPDSGKCQPRRRGGCGWRSACCSMGVSSWSMSRPSGRSSIQGRFMRGLPGKAQNWLWMHTWLGIVAILIALLHSNYIHILNNFCQNLGCFSEEGFGFSALVSLFALVISGVIGRLLDMWQARAIAQDASRNGTGIMQALEERILELEYTVERLCAGKSEPFKNYCVQALDHPHVLSGSMPRLYPQEQADFRRAHDTLSQRAQLVHSLRRQQRARFIIRTWRKLHICIATIALLIITAHSLIELLTYVFNVPIFQRFA